MHQNASSPESWEYEWSLFFSYTLLYFWNFSNSTFLET